MLIASRRHNQHDIDTWKRHERADGARAQLRIFGKRVDSARAALRTFAENGGYAGTSWGKDSTVLAHMVATEAPEVPLVWIRVEPICNPDCTLVRDAFLAQHPHVRYEEICVDCRRDDDGWHASGTLERGFAQAASRYGDRYASGLRAEESGARKLRMMTHGVNSGRTCAPIGWWTAVDVFAYLFAFGLPVHPAYACSMSGLLDRAKLRVASLGGQRGTGWGRAEWERRYYGQEIAALRRLQPDS